MYILSQGVLYKEYQDTRTEWEEERRSCQNKMEELKVERDQSNIKTEELEVCVHVYTVYNCLFIFTVNIHYTMNIMFLHVHFSMKLLKCVLQ